MSTSTVSKKVPLPHQRKALRQIVPAARRLSRLTTIMPCGTGKTMVQLWTAEGIGSKTILVLVPSLSLLRQTLREWMAQTKWQNVDVLCVCSDETVSRPAEDEIMISPEEVGHPVTSDSAEIATFLSKKAPGVKLVFSTYHSSSLVAAGMGKKFSFDLGIFDEAHVTAGEEGGLFSFALSEKNIRINVRSFWTATPRHYDSSKVRVTKDMPVVYSMDDEEVYGPRVHQLTFREAVKQEIICDYEVLVSVVTNKMIGVGAIQTGEVKIKGKNVPARTVAHHMALCQAINRYGVKKIFSFHPRVSEAEEFTNGGSESAVHHLPKDFKLFHVNGAMTTAFREEKVAAFREASRALMSNARCLTQGIDVPAVDMVAFLSKKRSLIDIVQATGRAMRKAPGKIKGYILIPLFVDQSRGETLEQAVERSDFREVWAVLNAMREQDEALADTMSRIRIKKGEDEDSEDQPDNDDDPTDTAIDNVTVIGPPQVRVKDLRRAITTICVDRLTSNWEEMYGRLLAFKKKYGHCRPTAKHDPFFARWVIRQRVLRKLGELSQQSIKKLDQLGFEWVVTTIRTEFYETLLEASTAAQKLGITKGRREYHERYKEDPLLASAPDRTYFSEWVNWDNFLGNEFYQTLEEAAVVARKFGFKNQAEYHQGHKSDPKLPAKPQGQYANWISWPNFLDTEGVPRKKRRVSYVTLAEASKAAQKLNIKTMEEYNKRRKRDRLLPSAPNKYYGSEWKGWSDFLGVEDYQKRRKNMRKRYPTLSQAANAAKKLGIKGRVEYAEKYKKDPLLPSSPSVVYAEDWVSWPVFLGKK